MTSTDVIKTLVIGKLHLNIKMFFKHGKSRLSRKDVCMAHVVDGELLTESRNGLQLLSHIH